MAVGGGDGGGGGGSSFSISLVAPSIVTVGAPVELVTVYGQGFTQQSQVLIDGQPSPSTSLLASGMLQAEISDSLNSTAGTHQFAVQNGGQVSNSLPYTVYAPPQGPFVMQAVPGFLVGEGEENAPFIVAADINGDGLADVVMPGPPLANTGSIGILYGQSNGTLSAAQYIPVPLTPYALAVGDIDGNGTADLVSITSNNGATSSTTVSVLFGDGHGNFQSPVSQQTFPGIYPGPSLLSDLNGDDKLDLILSVQNDTGANSKIFWLQNTGSGFAAPITLATTAANNPNFCIADFNGDGKPDILYAASDSSFHILINQGGGQFKDQGRGRTEQHPWLADCARFQSRRDSRPRCTSTNGNKRDSLLFPGAREWIFYTSC